jgi:hypothetical protein
VQIGTSAIMRSATSRIRDIAERCNHDGSVGAATLFSTKPALQKFCDSAQKFF